MCCVSILGGFCLVCLFISVCLCISMCLCIYLSIVISTDIAVCLCRCSWKLQKELAILAIKFMIVFLVCCVSFWGFCLVCLFVCMCLCLFLLSICIPTDIAVCLSRCSWKFQELGILAIRFMISFYKHFIFGYFVSFVCLHVCVYVYS